MSDKDKFVVIERAYTKSNKLGKWEVTKKFHIEKHVAESIILTLLDNNKYETQQAKLDYLESNASRVETSERRIQQDKAMSNNEDGRCDHPRRKVDIIETGTDVDVGKAAPRFWTVHGECDCGEVVEVDYEFSETIE